MTDAPEFTIRTNRKWRFLWLKAVVGVNLDEHCARALKGPYHKGVSIRSAYQGGTCATPDGVIGWYLCGVSDPYRWEQNFHAAWSYSPGETINLDEQQLALHVTNARLIRFSEADIAQDDPRIRRKDFYTCRNWQFAHAIANRPPTIPLRQHALPF